MNQYFKLSPKLISALKFLTQVAKEEKVPLSDLGGRGFTHLAPDFRRILYLLEWIDMLAQSQAQKETEAPSETVAAKRDDVPVTGPPPAENAAPVAFGPVAPESVASPMEPPQGEPPQAAPENIAPPEASQDHPAGSGVDPQPPQDGPEAGDASPSPAAAAKPLAADPPTGVTLPPLPPQAGGVPPFPNTPSSGGGVTPLEVMKKTIYLKNARANEPYSGAVDIEGLKSLKLSDDGGSGLTFDDSRSLLTGQPTTAGDFVLRFSGLLQSKRCEVTANLAVIPDPKSLWTSIDSNQSDPYWKPDEAFARVEGDLFCVAASKRGRSHAKDGTFRDDDFALKAQGSGGWQIAVVADGAGSAKYSRRGSKVAVDAVMDSLPPLLDAHLTPHLEKLAGAYLQRTAGAEEAIKSQLYQSLATSAFEAAKAIEDEALSKDEKASAFSTTLIIGVVRKLSHGWFIAAFSIGDGGAAVFDLQDQSLTTLTLPDNGEFAGQTRFLHKSEFAGGFPEVAKRLFFDIRQTFTAVTLMTDGITDPKFPTDVVFADPAKWARFWTEDLAQAVDFSPGNDALEQQFLDWLDFWSPGNHDDRTLVVLVP
jgi:serine/threonine protein phosphatase PrpC